MTIYEQRKEQLRRNPARWLVTGAAGFIGSNLVEELLRLGQEVVGLDDLSTGHRENLLQVASAVGKESWDRFKLIEDDIRHLDVCREACEGVDYVLHHAAMASVPRSLEAPLLAHDINVTGTLNLLLAAGEQAAHRFVYASSSAVYGDDTTLPKVEDKLGACLSPYALTKLANEHYAQMATRCYKLETVGLRYFNIFGPRQDPNGAYAAVIPKWVAAMMRGDEVTIFGDGETTRDFCHVADVVQANILAATAPSESGAAGGVFNVARHGSTTLNELYEILRARLAPFHPHLSATCPIYRDFRPGDIRHSEASIAAAERALGFAPVHTVASGLDAALEWYRKYLGNGQS
jgi:UDP-N-acetylglucosamine/UDP-N-acetylgalactosamine 4-epimerase